MADMVASVPELTKRTFSMAGKASMTSSARSASVGVEAPKLVPLRAAWMMASRTSGSEWPEDERSPGADVVDVAVAVGVPNVRAGTADQEGRDRCRPSGRRGPGEFTPPGISCSARFCNARDSLETADHGPSEMKANMS